MDRVYIIWYMTGEFTAGYTGNPSEIMKVAKEPSKAFTNNRLDRSGWQCCFRGSTASKARLETVEWSMRMLGAHPERYGDQDVDHEQDESLPTDVERVVSALDQTGARIRSQCYSHPVGPAVRQSYVKT